MADTDSDDKPERGSTEALQVFRETKFTPPEERESLTLWIALGIIMHDLYGLTWKETCRRVRGGKGYDTLRKSAASPAGKALREKIAGLADKPEKLSALLINAESMNLTVDFLLALDWAKEAHDYKAVHQMTKDLLKIAGVDEPKEKQTPQTVHIHLEGGSLDIPTIQTEYEVVDE